MVLHWLFFVSQPASQSLVTRVLGFVLCSSLFVSLAAGAACPKPPFRPFLPFLSFPWVRTSKYLSYGSDTEAPRSAAVKVSCDNCEKRIWLYHLLFQVRLDTMVTVVDAGAFLAAYTTGDRMMQRPDLGVKGKN